MSAENKGKFTYQKSYYDSQLQEGSNPYGHGSMQDELQKIRMQWVTSVVNPNSTFVDIGAGLGESSFAAKEVGAKVIALDASVQALSNIVSQNKNIPSIHADALNLPLPENMADVVGMWEILEHTENPKRLLSEAHRILKPNGHLLLSTPNANCLNRRAKKLLWGILYKDTNESEMVARDDHFKEYTYLETFEMLANQGFKLEKWQGFGLVFPIAWKVQSIHVLKPLIKLHVYSGNLAPSLAQETYLMARCIK